MKRYLYLISFICITTLFFSCSKSDSAVIQEDPIDNPNSDKVKSLIFNVPRFINDDETLTKSQLGSDGSSFQWSANDTVGIYPNTGSQVYFVMTKGAGTSSAEFDGGGWDFKPLAVYYSYYPFIGNIYLNREHVPVSFLGQKQIGTTSTSHIGPYDFMYTDATSASSGNLSFSYHHLVYVLYVRAKNLPAGTYTKLAITAPSQAFTSKGYFNLVASNPSIVSTENSNQTVIDLEGITVSESTEFYVYMVIAPTNLQGVEITVSILNDQRTEYQCKKTPSKTYEAGHVGGLGCTSWTAVPQSMGLIIDDWGDGGDIGGTAD